MPYAKTSVKLYREGIRVEHLLPTPSDQIAGDQFVLGENDIRLPEYIDEGDIPFPLSRPAQEPPDIDNEGVMVWESGARAAEEERGRVRRGRGTLGDIARSSSLSAGTRLPFTHGRQKSRRRSTKNCFLRQGKTHAGSWEENPLKSCEY
jgi:hypothetical protein